MPGVIGESGAGIKAAIKAASATPPNITGRHQCSTQANRDVGQGMFQNGATNHREVNVNE